MRDRRDGMIHRDVANFIKNYWRELVPLAESQNPIRFAEFDTMDFSMWQKMSRHDLITKTDDYNPKSRTWELSDLARERIKEYRDTEQELPKGTYVCPFCLQQGFRNLRGAGYQCQNPMCSREFDEFATV